MKKSNGNEKFLDRHFNSRKAKGVLLGIAVFSTIGCFSYASTDENQEIFNLQETNEVLTENIETLEKENSELKELNQELQLQVAELTGENNSLKDKNENQLEEKVDVVTEQNQKSITINDYAEYWNSNLNKIYGELVDGKSTYSIDSDENVITFIIDIPNIGKTAYYALNNNVDEWNDIANGFEKSSKNMYTDLNDCKLNEWHLSIIIGDVEADRFVLSSFNGELTYDAVQEQLN